jgi:hypothetical protein
MRITRTIIFYPIGLFVLFSLNTRSYLDFIKRFFKIGIALGIIRAMFDLICFITRTGVVNQFGRNITTFGGDIQVWFSIFSIILFSSFLYLKKRKYLYLSLLFLICLFFSYQRTAFFVTIIFYVSIYFIYLFLFTKKFIRTFTISLSISLLFILIGTLVLKTKLGKDLYLRYTSALVFTGYIENNTHVGPEYTDSGHYRQSTKVTDYLVKNLNAFWGGGINRRNEGYLNIEGQSKGGVHNNLVSMWQYFGIPGILYFAFLFLFVIFHFTAIIKNKNKINSNKFLLLSISNYFIIRFIAGWFSGDFFYMYYQICFQYIILFSAYKLNLRANLLIFENPNLK